jgi:hypothetical protein
MLKLAFKSKEDPWGTDPPIVIPLLLVVKANGIVLPKVTGKRIDGIKQFGVEFVPQLVE